MSAEEQRTRHIQFNMLMVVIAFCFVVLTYQVCPNPFCNTVGSPKATFFHAIVIDKISISDDDFIVSIFQV